MATILGLLLVVTFLANYLTATLPGQMSVNDLQHNVQVENQVGGLQAILEAGASDNVVGAQLSQPITLGSAGQPPFAGADSGWISAGNQSGGLAINFTASTTKVVGLGQDGAAGSGACSGGGFIRCPSGTWFTATVSTSAASDLLVLTLDIFLESAPLTTADVADTAGSTWNIITAGGSAIGGGSCPGARFCEYNFWALDSSAGTDTVSIGAAGLTAHDGAGVLAAFGGVLTANPISAVGTFLTALSVTPSATVVAPASGLVLGLVATAQGGAGAFPAVTADSTVTPCTVPCTAIAAQDGEAFGVAFSEYEPASTAGTYTASATLSVARNWGEVPIAINPAPVTVPPTLLPVVTGAPAPGASLVVHLRNTYIPTAEVSYDQGAVVFAQPGSVPVLVDPPAISYNGASLSVMIPVFQGAIASESGVGTTDVLARLVHTNTFDLPGDGLFVYSPSNVNLTLETPYWAAWLAFFQSNPNFSGDVTCTVSGAACPALLTADYETGGPIGTLVVSVPVTSLDLTVATYSIGLT